MRCEKHICLPFLITLDKCLGLACASVVYWRLTQHFSTHAVGRLRDVIWCCIAGFCWKRITSVFTCCPKGIDSLIVIRLICGMLHFVETGAGWYALIFIVIYWAGFLIVRRWGVSFHLSRSLWGCNAISFHRSLVDYYPQDANLHVYSCFLFHKFVFSKKVCKNFWPNRYVEVNMDSAAIVWPLFNSLQAFWPGLQVKFLFLT